MLQIGQNAGHHFFCTIRHCIVSILDFSMFSIWYSQCIEIDLIFLGGAKPPILPCSNVCSCSCHTGNYRWGSDLPLQLPLCLHHCHHRCMYKKKPCNRYTSAHYRNICDRKVANAWQYVVRTSLTQCYSVPSLSAMESSGCLLTRELACNIGPEPLKPFRHQYPFDPHQNSLSQVTFHIVWNIATNWCRHVSPLWAGRIRGCNTVVFSLGSWHLLGAWRFAVFLTVKRHLWHVLGPRRELCLKWPVFVDDYTFRFAIHPAIGPEVPYMEPCHVCYPDVIVDIRVTDFARSAHSAWETANLSISSSKFLTHAHNLSLALDGVRDLGSEFVQKTCARFRYSTVSRKTTLGTRAHVATSLSSTDLVAINQVRL